ncbi:MAG: PhoD-like phosphatase N-terminal domain-containing protein, partial [Pseudomonadota bacterium]
MPTLDRRQTLALITGGTLAACAAPQTEAAAPPALSPAFAHGVASGDPRTTSVVLWTRVTTDLAEQAVTWQLAHDAAFSDMVQSGEAVASAEADHTVKVIPEGLEPGAQYYFRFTTTGAASPTGRTRTLPVDALDRLGVALISCSNYPFGHFNAYDAIAKDADVDFVLHTGDYIYEYGADAWGNEEGTG